MSNLKPEYCLAALLLAAPIAASAESADRNKPIQVEADGFTGDEKNKTSTYTGNVVMTQGTMVLRADKAIIKQDAEGNYFATANGHPISYREKRDNSDEYLEAQAERLEYNGKLGQLQLFTKARLKRGADEVRGDYIFYDQQNGDFKVGPGGDAKPAPGQQPGRVRMTIQPKPKEGAPAGGKPAEPPTALKPSSSITKPREE